MPFTTIPTGEAAAAPPLEADAKVAMNRHRLLWLAGPLDGREEAEVAAAGGGKGRDLGETLRMIRDVLLDFPDAFVAVREAFREMRKREEEARGGHVCARCQGEREEGPKVKYEVDWVPRDSQ